MGKYVNNVNVVVGQFYNLVNDFWGETWFVKACMRFVTDSVDK